MPGGWGPHGLEQKGWTHRSTYLPWDLRETHPAGTVLKVFSKLRAMLGKKLLIFQARSLGSTPEALVQSTVWQVFEGLSGKSDSKEWFVAGAIVIVHITEGTTCGQGQEDTAKPQQKWYRSRADCQFLGNIQRAWLKVDPGAGPDNEAPCPPLALKYTPTGPSHSGIHFQGGSFERVGWRWDSLNC